MVASANDTILIELGFDSYQRLGERGVIRLNYKENVNIIIELFDDSELGEIEEEDPRGVQ